MRNLLIILTTILILCSCDETKKQNMSNNEIVLRSHTSAMKIDWYELKGKISHEAFIQQFQEVDWEKDFWTEYNNDTFNNHSIEAFNKDSMTYFGISVCPNTFDSFQYALCYGKHSILNDSTIYRTVKLYGTGSDNPDVVIDFINLYFSDDVIQFENELTKIDFFEEIEDVYFNIKAK